MRYQRTVEKLPVDEPFLCEAYVFGDVLDGTDRLDTVQVALVLNLPPDPGGTAWLVDLLRLDKGGYSYWWRSHLDPVWNHYIRRPVRFWSVAGPDEEVLQALAVRRFDDLPTSLPDPADEPDRLMEELGTALEER